MIFIFWVQNICDQCLHELKQDIKSENVCLEWATFSGAEESIRWHYNNGKGEGEGEGSTGLLSFHVGREEGNILHSQGPEGPLPCSFHGSVQWGHVLEGKGSISSLLQDDTGHLTQGAEKGKLRKTVPSPSQRGCLGVNASAQSAKAVSSLHQP